MDPTFCLELALRALLDNDREDAIEHLANLTDWLRLGGFPPDVAQSVGFKYQPVEG
jgi:hypothetical protein